MKYKKIEIVTFDGEGLAMYSSINTLKKSFDFDHTKQRFLELAAKCVPSQREDRTILVKIGSSMLIINEMELAKD